MLRIPRAAVVLTVGALLGAPRSASAFRIHQLTFTGNNVQPCLNDGAVCWVRTNWATGDEIYVSHLGGAHPVPARLTDNGGEKAHPSSHGSEKIVWQGRASGSDDWEIFSYSRYDVPLYSAFTDNTIPDTAPVLAGGGHFVWLQGATMFEEVHYWNESLHHESVLSDDCCPTTGFSNDAPTADDYTVVWRSYDRVGTGGHKVYCWDGTLIDLSEDVQAGMAHGFSLYRDTLAYEWGASPSWITYWDGATAQTIAAGYSPSLFDGAIAYEVWDGHDWEIHYWNGASIVEITDNEYDDTQPSLCRNTIAWVGRPEGLDQIFYATHLLDVAGDPQTKSVHGTGCELTLRGGPQRDAPRDWVGGPVPTPFRHTVSLGLQLRRPEHVSLTVFSAAGRLVRTLLDEDRSAGYHAVMWDGRSDDGEVSGPGVYFVRVEAGVLRAHRRTVLLPR